MQTLYIHPQTPQSRLIKQATTALQDGLAIIVPTAFGYGLAIGLNAQKTFNNLNTYLNQPTAYLLCNDLSQLSNFANLDNTQFAQVRTYQKQETPPIFTLPADKNAPKFLGKTAINCTFAKDPIALALLEDLGEPFIVLVFDEDCTAYDYEMGETYGHLAQVLLAIGELQTIAIEVSNLVN